ncbi:filamentous hemagglutinin N-terminal domain-containing protein [Roseomonas hellenica]|uniref:Filamentous hemagglutinin N-terminal domain-containing protein n=1 Tax=Plastoroseomonas hellenica TaxID=2687306 RepID=A0ABS5F5S4_9PROT|nr:filamentous hemagglutinin N-terminal domain-containing protein [Plastoroseomonas hellenica]MBR0667899.1 filamentous hemagglutinin N-terminal domain-containing protein [Plastoroseomonas hellenica]
MAERAPLTSVRTAAPSGASVRDWLLRTTALLPIAFGAAGAGAQVVATNAGPTGGQVVAGQASIATAPNRTTITQTTDRGVINWQQFNVGSQHTVQFQQPNAGSWTLNRVVTSDPSVIAGRIQANGGVAIVNQSGIVFGQGAQVDVGSLIASAPGITNDNFMAGRMRFDQAALPGARVENRGRITVPDRGIAVLAGPRVTNSGEIHARLGRVVLAGAEAYALDLAGDGLLSIDITQAVRGDGAAVVTNEGVIEANGGSVLLTASAAGDLVEGLVRNTGRITANTEAGRTGEVALRAAGGGVEVTGTITATGGAGQRGGRIAVQSGESVRVGTGAVLDASGGTGGGTVLVGTTGVGRNQTMARRTTVERGATISADATVLGQGGTIAINSTEMTVVEGRLTARGGPQGGDGGLIELSGQGEMRLNATWDASAPAGQAGSLLLDPTRIEVLNDSTPDDTIPATGPATISATSGGGTLQLNAAELSASTGNIILEALLGIRITGAVTKAQGDLTLRTTAAAGTNGLDGISIEAPVHLTTGSFTASTAGTFTIAGTGSLSVGGAAATITAIGNITFAGILGGLAVGLNTDGDIVQTGGLLAAESLSIRGANGTAASRAGSANLVQLGNDIRLLDARTTGVLVVVTDPTGGQLTIRQADGAGMGIIALAGGSLLIQGSASGGIGVTSTADVTLRGDSIAVQNSVTGGASPLVFVAFELRDGGALTGTGAITTAGGTVRTGADGAPTALRIVDSGTAGAGSIMVSSQTLGQVSAGVLAIGSIGGATVTATSIAVGGAIAPQAGTRVQLEALSGNIDIGAGITGTGVTAIALGGAITLDSGFATAGGVGQIVFSAANAVTLNGNVTGDGAIITSAEAGITLGGTGSIDVGSGALTLQAAGGVTQNAGAAITTGSLSVLGATGGTSSAASVDLGRAGNAITALDQVRATGGIIVHGGSGTLSIGAGANVIGANVTLIATGGITQTAGSINAGAGALTFRSDGAIGQSGGTVTAGSLSTLGAAGGTTAAASVNLGQSGNAVAALDQLRATGDITIQAGAGALAIDSGAAISGANITLTATGDIVQAGGAINAGSGAGTLTLQSDGAVGQTGGTIAAGSLSVLGAAGGTTAAASINLDQSGNAIAALDQVRAIGDIAIHAGAGTLAIGTGAAILGANIALTATGDITQTAGTINAGSGAGTMTLQSDGTVSQAGGTINAGSLNVLGAAGGTTAAVSISLGQSGNAIATLGQVLAIGDVAVHAGGGTLTIGDGAAIRGANVTLIAAAAVSQTAGTITATSGGSLTLRSDGAVGQTGGTITAGSLNVLGAAGGTDPAASVNLGQSDNAIAAIGQIRVTGDITIHAGTGADPLSIGAIGTTTGNIALSAARAIDVTGAVSGVNLTITGTTITIAATGQVTATGGDLVLNATDASGIAFAAGSSLTGASGHRLVLRADALSIDAGAALTLTGTAVEVGPQTGGHTVLLGAAGSGLSLDVATLGRLTGSGATSLRFGETTIGADTQRGGDLTLGSGLSFTSGDLTLVSGGAVALGANAVTTTGHNFNIHADGVVSGSGTLQAASLVIRGATGDSGSAAGAVTLDGANSAVGILDARSTGDIVFANTGAALTVRRASGASVAIDALGQAVTVEAGGAGIVASDDVSLRASSIALGAGIAAGNGQTLSLQIASGGTITGAGTLSAIGGTIEIGAAATGAALTVGASGIATSVLGAAQADTIVVGRSSFNGGAAITADSVTVSSAVAVMASVGTLSFRAGSDVILNAAVSTGSNRAVALDAGRDIVQTAAGLITTGRLDANAGRDILLHAGDPGRTILGTWNQIATLGGMTAGGNLVLNANGALGITGNVLAANATIAAKGALSLGSAATITTIGGTTQLAAGGVVTLAGVIDAGSGGTVTIGSSAAITQTDGSITAGTFGASGTTINLSGGTGNNLGALALRATTGNLAFDTDGTLTLAGTVNVAIIGGSDAFGGLSAAGDLSVSAGTIIGGAGTVFQAGAGRSITLRADTLSLDSNTTIGAQGGGALASLSIGPRTDGRTMVIGGPDIAGTLTLSDGTVARLLLVNAPLRLGQTVVGGSTVLAGDVRVATSLTVSGSLTLAGSNDITFDAATQAADLTAIAGRDIILPATVTTTGGNIILSATRSITQTGGGLNAGSGLVAANAGGDIDLRAGTNSFTSLAAASSGGAVRVATNGALATGTANGVPLPGGGTTAIAGLTAATDVFLQAAGLTVAHTVAGNSVTLRANTLDIQAGGLVTGTTMVAIEPLGTGPAIQIGGADVGGTLSINNAELGRINTPLLVFGRSDNARDIRTAADAEAGTNWSGALRLIGNNVTIAGTLAPSSLALWVSGTVSDIEGGTFNIGTVNTPGLTLRGLAGGETDGGSIIFEGRYQTIDALDIRSAGTVRLFLDPNASTVQANQLRGASVELTVLGGGITIGSGGATTTSGNLTLQASGALSIDGALSVTGGNLTLRGASVTTAAAGDAIVTGTALVAATGGGATLDGDITASSVTLTATGAMSVSGAMQATTGLTVSGSSVALTSGVTVNNGAVSITATGGSVTVGGAISGLAVTVTGSDGVAIGGDVTATGTNVLIDAGQAMVLTNNVTAAGSVTLRANSITQTTGVISGTGGSATGLVAVGRTGDVILTGDNFISILDATAAGSLSVRSAATETLVVARATGTGSVTLDASALSLTGAVGGAGATVDLRTSTGGVTQTGTGIITAQTLAGDVIGDVALATAANAVAETGSFTFSGNFALRTSGSLAVTEALTATSGKTITLQAAGNLALQDSLRADTVSLAATFGGISQTGGIIAAVTSGVRTSLDASAGAGVALDSTANDVGMLTGGNGGSGGFLLRNNGDLAVTGLVQTGAGTTLQLDAAGTITLASSGTLSAAGGTVALAADGAVTLAGTLTAMNAFITTASTLQQAVGGIATTGVLAVRATDISLQGPGNAISQLAAEATAGNVVVASTGTMAIGSGTPPGGTLITGVSGNTVFLTAGGLNINQAVTSAPGSTVTLRADSMNIAAAVSASGGTVLLEQATPSRSISLGAENPATLSLSTTELAQIHANLLVIGRGSGQIIVAGDIQAPASVPTLRLLGSDIAVNALLAGPVGGVTQLQALTGSITTAGFGRVTGQRLEASAAGNIALTGANDFAEVAGSAPGNLAYRDSNGFAVAAPGIQAGSVSLSTDAGNITQQAGAAIATGALDARAAAGSVLLDGGSAASAGADLNRVGAVTRLVASSGGLALLRNAHGFDMAGLADNGAGGTLGTLRLFAASGSITQSAGPLRVTRLEAETPGGSLLLGQANGITTLGDIRVAGDLVVTNDGSLILAAPIDVGSFGGGGFGTAILTVNNGNLLQAAGARLSADQLVANALTGSVLLDGGGSTNPADLLRVGNLAGGYAAQSMVLRFGNAITVTGLVQAGATAGTPTGTLALEAPGIAIGSPGQGGTLLRAGTVVLRTQADFDGPAIAGSGSIVQQGGAIEAVNLAASAPSGDVLLGLTSNRFNALAAGFSANGSASTHSLIAGGSIDIAEGGPGFIVLGGLQNGGSSIQLRSLGDLTFNAATSVGGPIDLSAAGTVTIGTAADLRSDTLLTLNGGAGITVQGAVTASDILANTGGSFTLADSGRIAGGSAPGGSVSVTAGHVETSGGVITAHDVTLQTGTGTIVNTTFGAQGLVNILAGGALRVAGVGVNADAMQARTNGLLTLAGGSYTIGSVVVFAGSAGINTEGTVQVRPRTSGTFPAIVLDSRAPGTQPDPLTIARPDVTGLAPDLQETQVRLPNTDAPGDFGAASSAPAGAIRFSLDAQQSPLFLLIDGGSATGTVNTSGRIGIHGRGGTVEITGTLVDSSGQRIEGQAAARMTDATRPATGAEISRFRINDCVVSSFNCVVPAQVIVVPTAAPVPPPLIYGGVGRDPDAVSPNVSEEWTAPGDDEEDDKR